MIHTSIADGVATLTLDHPPLNILTQAMLTELRGALDRLADDLDARVLVMRAAGDQFSAGADVGEHLPPRHREMIPEFVATVRRLAEFPAPVVAAVRGRCLGGGCELVQAADIVVAGEGATFGQPEIRLGVSPPAACALLPGLVGPAFAAELVLLGDVVDAARARDAGLVARVVPDARVDDEARVLAARIARSSGAALRLTKRALRQGVDAGRARALAACQAIYLDELMRTDDAEEGLRAFLEKRTPQWTHS